MRICYLNSIYDFRRKRYTEAINYLYLLKYFIFLDPRKKTLVSSYL